MNSFRRGLRNRNPLVLVVALVLLVPALLGIQSWFTSGGWTAIAAERWERNSTDDYMYVSWVTSHLKKDPPSKPLAVLLGGSSGREALVSGPSLAAEVKADGGPEIVAYNLSSRMQRYAQSWAIVDNLPDTPTTVLVGVNLGRFTTSPREQLQPGHRPRAAAQERLAAPLGDRPLRRAQVLVHDPAGHLLGARVVPAAEGERLAQGQAGQAVQGARVRPAQRPCRTRRSAGSSARGSRKYYPAFKKVHQFDATMLDGLIAEGQKRGLDMVIVELPWNREIVGDGWSTTAMAAVPGVHQAIAAKYDVPYLDFNDELDIPSEDFLDLSHLRPAGRAIWQSELARQLAALYDDGTLRTEL